VELIFPNQREGVWVGKLGLIAVVPFFLLGSCLAWYSWTRFARPNVFHVPVYNPPPEAILLAGAAICGLIFSALGPFRNRLARDFKPLQLPSPGFLGAVGAVWAVLWYGLVLLAFGIAPSFPPSVAISVGLVLAAGILVLLPRWAVDPRWHRNHGFALIFGTMLGSMLAGFIGFIGAARVDLHFKIAIDILAVALMIALGFKVSRQSASDRKGAEAKATR
jgi:hypothetical protein